MDILKYWNRSSLVVLVVVALTGCGAAVGSPTAAPSTVRMEATRVAQSPPCAQVGVKDCFQVANGTWAAVDSPSGSAGLILVDMGGPGAFVENFADVRKELPSWTGKYALVSILETWSSWNVTPSCEKYFGNLSWQLPTSVSSCAYLDNYYQPAAQSTVSDIEKRTGLPLTGIVTFSFGATRTAGLWGSLNKSSGFLIVAAPAAVAGPVAQQLAEQRGSLAEKALSRATATGCSGPPACASISSLVQRIASARQDKVQGVGGPELSLFLLATATQPSSYTSTVLKLRRGQTLSTDEIATVKRMAWSFSHTLGSDQALGSNLGFRGQMCQAYGQPDGKNATADPLARAFLAQLGPCPTGRGNWGPPTAAALPDHSCLYLNPADSVVGPDWSPNQQKNFGPNRTRSYTVLGHAWPGDQVRALAPVVPGKPWACGQ